MTCDVIDAHSLCLYEIEQNYWIHSLVGTANTKLDIWYQYKKSYVTHPCKTQPSLWKAVIKCNFYG